MSTHECVQRMKFRICKRTRIAGDKFPVRSRSVSLRPSNGLDLQHLSRASLAYTLACSVQAMSAWCPSQPSPGHYQIMRCRSHHWWTACVMDHHANTSMRNHGLYVRPKLMRPGFQRQVFWWIQFNLSPASQVLWHFPMFTWLACRVQWKLVKKSCRRARCSG